MAEYDERRRLLLADIKKYEQDRKEFTQYVAQVAKEVRFLHFALKGNQGPPEDTLSMSALQTSIGLILLIFFFFFYTKLTSSERGAGAVEN